MATAEFLLGTWWQPPTELGGWSLSVRHVLDASRGVVYPIFDSRSWVYLSRPGPV